MSTLALIDKLCNILSSIAIDFANVCVHMKEASTIFLQLGRDAQKFKYKTNTTIAYAHWNSEFSKGSEIYGKISKIYNEDIREYFDFMKMSMISLNPLFQKFELKRDAYETYGVKLKEKKEALFESKKYSKWETDPTQYLDFQALQNDKKKSFSIMCYKENVQFEDLKKHVSVITHKLHEEFLNVCKYQEEKVTDFSSGFYERNKRSD